MDAPLVENIYAILWTMIKVQHSPFRSGCPSIYTCTFLREVVISALNWNFNKSDIKLLVLFYYDLTLCAREVSYFLAKLISATILTLLVVPCGQLVYSKSFIM